jgi:hypothetical protein
MNIHETRDIKYTHFEWAKPLQPSQDRGYQSEVDEETGIGHLVECKKRRN